MTGIDPAIACVERDVMFDKAFAQADQLFADLSARPDALCA